MALATVGSCALMLAPAVAQAHYVQTASFGSGQLSNPVGVAVDQSSHDVYVANLLFAGNDKYDPSSNLLSPPSPFSGGSGVYSGAAVNPANGDLYVVDGGGQAIDTYDPNTGALVGTPFPVPGSANLLGAYTVVQIAADAAGNVYVPNAPNNDVQEYSPSGTLLSTFAGSGATALSAPTGVAVDSSGNVWVADDGSNRIEEFDPTGATVLRSIASPGVQDVAVDMTGDVFASVTDSSGSHVTEYDASGAQVDDFGLGTLGASSYGSPNSVAVDATSGNVYVADGANNVVRVYQEAPTVTTGQATDLSQTSVTLNGTVSPSGLPLTDCHFEYGSAWTEPSSEVSVPCSPAASAIPGDSAAHAVTASISGLTPGSVYHFRLAAANANASSSGSYRAVTTSSPGQAASCPNAQFRTGYSASLPDCRAFEVVDPANSGDSALPVAAYGFPDGRHVYFASVTPDGNTGNGDRQNLLSTRSSAGWQTVSLALPQGPGQPVTVSSSSNPLDSVAAFTSDASAAFVNNPFDDDPLDQDNGAIDVYRVDTTTGASSIASLPDTGPMTSSLTGPANLNPPGNYLAGVSADGSKVFWVTGAQLPTAPGTPADTHTSGLEIYERTEGHTYLVGILPGGSVPACGADVGDGPYSTNNDQQTLVAGAIAPDGSDVVFTASDCGTSGLYLRNLAGASTVQLPGQTFLSRTPDGSKILTQDSSGTIDEYDIASGQTTAVGQGALIGESADGSIVYYTDNTTGSGAVYIWDNGTTREIPGTAGGGYAAKAALSGSAHPPDMPAVTPDGSKLLFVDSGQLTGYDNTMAGSGNCSTSLSAIENPTPHCYEVYLYDATTNRVTCVSCDPTGAPPLRDGHIVDNDHFDGNKMDPPTQPLISSDGTRAVFESPDPLVPHDANGAMDVYEWNNGHLSLLSTGQGAAGAYLLGATPNLSNVYFETSQPLLPGVDNSMHIYDARIDGGFPAPSGPAACSGDACQGALTGAPALPTAASVTFAGPGDATSGARPVRPRLLTRTLHGTSFVVRVTVPGAGRVTIVGSGVRTVRRSVLGAGMYRLRVTLTAGEGRLLARGHGLKLTLRVSYAPPGASAATASVRLTVLPALHHARRAATRKRGGAR